MENKKIKNIIKIGEEVNKVILDKLKEDLKDLRYCKHDKKIEQVIEKNGDTFCMACVRDIVKWEAKKGLIEKEIVEINKFIQRLRGYGCGQHIQLDKQMLNRIKELQNEVNDGIPPTDKSVGILPNEL